MLFKKNNFSKNLEQLIESLAHAEKWAAKARSRDDIHSFNQANKALENASKLLTSLCHDIFSHKTPHFSFLSKASNDHTEKPHDERLTLKKQEGEYYNMVNRYKLIQQEMDSIRQEMDSVSPSTNHKKNK